MSSAPYPDWSDCSPRIIESIQKAIADANDQLRTVSQEIHEHPELAWEEHHTHDVLTDLMETRGFQVVRHAYGLATAWSASYEVGQGGKTIGFNSEMDALKGIGHACGHNLIAMSGCAAAIGVAAALKELDIPGKVLLLGTPAEESGGGKVELLKLGAYKDMAACLMVHPGSPGNGSASATSNAIAAFTVTYTGKSAHAAGAPETAINALDAAVAAYVNISVLRQQIPGSNRVHGIICGDEDWSSNVIPKDSKLEYGIRAPNAAELIALVPRVLNCFKAAALSTGCTCKITRDHLYLDLQPCSTLEDYYKEFCGAQWGEENYEVSDRISIGASTDFGNVTYRLPGMHPMFMLPDARAGEFPREARLDALQAAAITSGAHQAAIKAAVAIAVVGARVIIDKKFGQATREAWVEQMKDIDSTKITQDLDKLLSQYPQSGE